MKNILFLITFLTITFTLTAQEQTKEILLIGTMHTVPKMFKNSYEPLLDIAKSYKPQAIYVEAAMPNDTLSWEYLKDGYSSSFRKFYKLSDSLQQEMVLDEMLFQNTLKKEWATLTKEDLKVLIKSFAYLRDYANFCFYKRIEKYGIEGSKKPTRHENHDLSDKLALNLNIKTLFSTDDQQTNKEFHDNWIQCEQEIKKTEHLKYRKKVTNKLIRKILPGALVGNYGISNNKLESLEMLAELSSLKHAVSNESCAIANDYFNQRDARIVQNLGKQIEANNHSKNVLIIGSSHIVGVKKELEKNFPNVKIVMVSEL